MQAEGLGRLRNGANGTGYGSCYILYKAGTARMLRCWRGREVCEVEVTGGTCGLGPRDAGLGDREGWP